MNSLLLIAGIIMTPGTLMTLGTVLHILMEPVPQLAQKGIYLRLLYLSQQRFFCSVLARWYLWERGDNSSLEIVLKSTLELYLGISVESKFVNKK